MEPVTKKPCIDICEFNKKEICKACGRTCQEKKQWKLRSSDEKRAIWTRILDAHDSGKGEQPRRSAIPPETPVGGRLTSGSSLIRE